MKKNKVPKFTQKVKDNWLNNLKSGKYKQGYGALYDEANNAHCCIGVLGACTPGLDNNAASSNYASPYNFLKKAIGKTEMREIYMKNDTNKNDITYKGGYENVIPLIEALPVEK